MRAIPSNETCILCGGTATSRDEAVYLYCSDCESVSEITTPRAAVPADSAADQSGDVDRWDGQGGAIHVDSP